MTATGKRNTTMPTTQRTEAAVASADGTRISYDVQGRGPTVILISQALADRKDHRRLAAALPDSLGQPRGTTLRQHRDPHQGSSRRRSGTYR